MSGVVEACADRASGGAAPETDDQRLTRFGVKRHGQMADRPVDATASAPDVTRLMIPFEMQQKVFAVAMDADGPLDTLLAPDDFLIGVAQAQEQIEWIFNRRRSTGKRRDRNRYRSNSLTTGKTGVQQQRQS